jgi:hypothetical protein
MLRDVQSVGVLAALPWKRPIHGRFGGASWTVSSALAYASARGGAMVLTALALAGCVTINIYFPASAAEKAADRIIEEVYQTKKGETAKGAPAASPASSPSPAGDKK